MALCMCISISATVQLGCLFVPKVYIVLFQPHKNVRAGGKGSGVGSSGPGRPLFGRPSSRLTGLAAMTNGDASSPSKSRFHPVSYKAFSSMAFFNIHLRPFSYRACVRWVPSKECRINL
jgi:hypothetical protein